MVGNVETVENHFSARLACQVEKAPEAPLIWLPYHKLGLGRPDVLHLAYKQNLSPM